MLRGRHDTTSLILSHKIIVIKLTSNFGNLVFKDIVLGLLLTTLSASENKLINNWTFVHTRVNVSEQIDYDRFKRVVPVIYSLQNECLKINLNPKHHMKC